MAESDSQGEDLPPFTPLGQDKPQDLEDLPEYTPFSDQQKGKAPAAETTSESPSMPVLQEAVSEEVVVEDVLQSEYVQEMVVAAEGPGDVVLEPLVPGESQAEIAIKESDWEIIESEECSETVVVVENTIEKVTFKPEEEQKSQLEEEKPQGGKAKGKKKRGGKGKASDTPTADTQSETSRRQEDSQPVSAEKDEIATEVPRAELVQKPVGKTLEREEEVKAVPRESQADDWSFEQDLKDMVSVKKPTMQGNKDRKKVKSGRPAKPSTEEVKAPMQEETKETTPYEEQEKPKQPIPQENQILRSDEPAAILPVEEVQSELHQTPLIPTVSEDKTVEKPKQQPVQTKGKWKQKEAKPPVIASPEVSLTKPSLPEEIKEISSVQPASEEPTVEVTPKQPSMQPKRKQKQRSGKPAAAPLLAEEAQAPAQDVTPEPARVDKGEEMPKPVVQTKDPIDTKPLLATPLVKPPIPEESKEGPSVPAQSEEIKEGEKPKQPKTQAKGKQKQSSEKLAAASLPAEKTQAPVQDSTHEPQKPTVSEDIVEEKPKQPPAQAKGKGKQKNSITPVAAPTEVPPAKPALVEETKEIPSISAASEAPIGEVKPKQPTMQAKGKQQKQRSGKPAATLPEEAPLTTTRETHPIPPPAEAKDTPKGPAPQTEKPKQPEAPKEPSKSVVQQPISERKPTEEQKKATPESIPQAAKSSGWKKIVKESLALEPKEPLQPVISPIQPPVEETKKPVLQAKGQNKTRSGKPVTQATSQEESKAAEAPRQGLSAQARKKQNDRRTDRGPKPAASAAPAAVEVPKPTGPKPVKDPQVLELERQIHLTKEKQKNAKLLTAKLQKTIEENNAKKERVERQNAKARQTLAQLTEELSKSKVPYTESKEEALLKQLKARVRILTEDLTTKETDFAALRSLKEAKAKETRGLEARHQQLEDQKRKLIAEHSEAVSESESYHSEIKRLEGLIKRANIEIEDMKGSFSSLDLDSELKDWETKRTAKARELGEEEGRFHASLSMLETERLAYYPEQAVNTIGSGKLTKELEDLDAKLREKTEEVDNLRGELEEGQAGCCPFIFLLIGILLGVLVQLLVRY